MTVTAYERNDTDSAALRELPLEVIDQLIAKMKDQHIQRLQQGACTIEKGFIFSDILNNCRRISDHCSNIAVAVIEVEHDSFECPVFAGGVKGNHEFNLIFQEYAAKYAV